MNDDLAFEAPLDHPTGPGRQVVSKLLVSAVCDTLRCLLFKGTRVGCTSSFLNGDAGLSSGDGTQRS
jgi:hypothetical protein